MKNKSLNNPFCLTPLYIGITGHRDIRDQDREPLKNIICEFIRGKQIRYPHTPFVLLTPLNRMLTQYYLNGEYYTHHQNIHVSHVFQCFLMIIVNILLAY